MLTDTKIRQTKPGDKPLKLADGNGLYLLVQPNGSKLWRYRYRIGGRENVFAVGAYPETGLAAARSARDEARKLVRQGIHPSHVRQEARAERLAENRNTFEAVAREWVELKRGTVGASYLRNIEQVFARYVYPAIGRLPVRSITPHHVMACLDKCRHIPVTGINARNRMSAVFMYAVRTLRLENDPTLPFADYFKRPPIRHAQAVGKDGLAVLLSGIRSYKGTRVVVLALQMLLYTGLRTVEVRRAEWSEFRMDEDLWVIPADKMKRRRIHSVPLSRQVKAMLDELRGISGNGRLLFPNSRRPDDLISATTVNRALEYIGAKHLSGHDFRATVATHLSEMGWPKEYIDVQLAHGQNNTDAAYFHTKFLPQRREMMQAWAGYLDGLETAAS